MKRIHPFIESLEGRELLSVTLGLDPTSNPTGLGIIFQPLITVSGQAAPNEVVTLTGGGQPQRTTADPFGHYDFSLKIREGTTDLKVTAADSSMARLAVTYGNLVTAWNEVALEPIRLEKTPPPIVARDLAIVQSAIFDAVNAIDPLYAPYHVTLTTDRTASINAAIACAAKETLSTLFPAQDALFAAAFVASFNGNTNQAATQAGLNLGKSAADQILAWRTNDGSTTQVNYVPGTTTASWVPAPPKYAPAVLPQWGQVIPFGLNSGSQFRPAPPPALTSAEYAAALNQDESLGAANSTTRTADETQIALFWDDGPGTETPPGHWNTIATDVAIARHDSVVKDAHLFALLDIAEADAGIAAWDSKYTYNFVRPVTMMRAGDSGNPQIGPADPTWSPLIATPAFPSYVSGHSTFSAAAAAVLSAQFGNHVKFSTTSDFLPGVTRSFTSFEQAAQEAGMSRIYGGIHYSFDNEAGLTLGTQVGQYDVKNALPRK